MSKLTIFANAILILVAAHRVLPVLKGKYSYSNDAINEKGGLIYEWLLLCFEQIIKWIQEKKIDGMTFYRENVSQSVNYLGYYHKNIQIKEFMALQVCDTAIAFFCLTILKYEKNMGIYQKKRFPSDLEFSIEYLEKYLVYAQQASDNPEAEKEWQEKIITHLLQDYYTDNPEEFGENISRAYIEELLGENLPF